LLPAGTYTVDTEELRIEAPSVPGWKRVSTTIRLTRNGAAEYAPVDPDELIDTLSHDGVSPDPTVPDVLSPVTKREKTSGILNAPCADVERY
jgi:hypothetical protein